MAEPPSTTDPDSFDANALELPSSLRTCCRYLLRDTTVSVHTAVHEPNFFASHRHPAVQIAIALEAAMCDVSWAGENGPMVHSVLGANQIWILPAGVLHAIHWRRRARLILLLAAPAWAKHAGYEGGAGAMIANLSHYELVDPLIGGLKLAFGDQGACGDAPFAPQLQSLGQCLAARIFGAQSSLLRRRCASVTLLHPDTHQRVVAFIKANLGVEISSSALAREARMSPSHFLTVFKASTGLTPEQYVLRTRLWKARELIRAGTRTIGEIAHATGFSDHSHLTVQFRRRFGVPPKAYLPAKRYV